MCPRKGAPLAWPAPAPTNHSVVLVFNDEIPHARLCAEINLYAFISEELRADLGGRTLGSDVNLL